MVALTDSQTVPVTETDVSPIVVTTVTVIRPLLTPDLLSSSETAVRVCARTPEKARIRHCYAYLNNGDGNTLTW